LVACICQPFMDGSARNGRWSTWEHLHELPVAHQGVAYVGRWHFDLRFGATHSVGLAVIMTPSISGESSGKEFNGA